MGRCCGCVSTATALAFCVVWQMEWSVAEGDEQTRFGAAAQRPSQFSLLEHRTDPPTRLPWRRLCRLPLRRRLAASESPPERRRTPPARGILVHQNARSKCDCSSGMCSLGMTMAVAGHQPPPTVRARSHGHIRALLFVICGCVLQPARPFQCRNLWFWRGSAFSVRYRRRPPPRSVPSSTCVGEMEDLIAGECAVRGAHRPSCRRCP